MPGEHELDQLLERYSNAQCLIGEVLEIQRKRSGGDETAVRLTDAADGRQRIVLAPDRLGNMFPDFVHERTVRIVCRSVGSPDNTIFYDFLHLAHVEGISRDEEVQLWPWKDHAYRLLVDPSIRLSQFEEDLCRSLTWWGRPPSEKQRAVFRQISERQSGPQAVSRESLLRAARYRPRLNCIAPQPVGDALLHALYELRQIWLKSQA